MNNFDEIKTAFLRSVCHIGHLCVHPRDAYKRSYSEYLFAGVVIPCLTYLFFALNLGLERLSFLSSATGLKTTLLVFFGVIVGAVTSAMLAGVAYVTGRVTGKEINGFRFVGCVEYSFGLALVIELIGLIIRLITNANTTASFGVLGIFVALISVFRCIRQITEAPTHIWACFAALGGILTMLGLNILFFASF
ncbi:MAG: hypothetical protein J6B51_07695 [Clostridia bacterium]|nr:hypothetical protein [Clostridia bacterium]MBO5299942.1 hypothetical protein [Clostridia bacterium]